MKIHILAIALALSAAQNVRAEEPEANVTEKENKTSVSVDALAFFRDNEYDSKLTAGYTLPGAWVRPKLEYAPNANIHLELGAHALFFDGANKYPCYAYHDIGHWKGNQYQSGAHVLPWFRAQVRMRGVSVVLGDIYGDTFHDIITPLYNKEQVMSADPEMGAQILVSHRGFSMDAWVNWQSYQFKEDTHQEAFTVGVAARQRLGSHVSILLNALAQHRGGEQDKTDLHLGVQTIYNGSIGVGYSSGDMPAGRAVNSYGAEANLIGCYQQSGKLWPFDSGIAMHAEGRMELIRCLSLRLGYLYAPGDFISLYGNPFFSTVSVKDAGTRFDGMGTGYFDIDYHRTFAGHYTLGALLETYKLNATGLNEFNFAFGLYLRVNPSWGL